MSHAVVLCGGVSLTCLMLFCVRSFSYTPHVVSCGVSLTHSCSSMWEVSLTRSLLFYVGGGGGWVGGGGGILLHGPCYFMWGVSFTWPMLFYVGNFSYTLRGVYVGFFRLHYWCLFLCRKFVFHALCYLISGISLTHPMQVYVGRFSNSMQCVLSCKEFLLYSLCCFMWEISLTVLSALY